MTQATESIRKDAVSLPFFGVPRILPYVKKYKKTLLAMLICGLIGTGMDIAVPLFQRYACSLRSTYSALFLHPARPLLPVRAP